MFRPHFRNREEKESELPKPSPPRPVQSTSVVKAIIAQFLAENPAIADIPENGEVFDKFLKAEAQGFYSLEGLRVAAAVLKDKIIWNPPPAPSAPVIPPEPPTIDYAALTDADELPPETPSWRLEKATKKQLANFLRRAQEEGRGPRGITFLGQKSH